MYLTQKNHLRVDKKTYKLLRILSHLSKDLYNLTLYGINFIEVDEAYTSKADALALESLVKKEEYWGKRVKRGLYQSSTGVLINADVNGALNILRKVAGDSLVGGIAGSGRVNRPVRVRLPATGCRMNSHETPP